MHFLLSSSVCVLLPIDIFFGCDRIKLDINGIGSYRITYKNILIYRTNSIYRTALAEIQLFENLRVQKQLQNIEKIAFKVVQMKFLAMHITNKKLSFDIFTVGNLQNIFMEYDLYLMS